MQKDNLLMTLMIILILVGAVRETIIITGGRTVEFIERINNYYNNLFTATKKDTTTVIEFSAKEFYGDKHFIRAIAFFEDRVKVIIKDMTVLYEYNGLNAIEGLFPVKLYHYLKKAWFVNCISEIKPTGSSITFFDCWEHLSLAYNNIDPISSSCPLFQSDLQDTIELKPGPIAKDMLSWGVDWINAERVWGGEENATDVKLGHIAGEGIKVGIIDSGIDYFHFDLSENYAGGISFVVNDADPMDHMGHGTHVAGIVAAADNDRFSVIGVAPKVSLYAIKVANPHTTKSETLSNVIKGINWAIEQKLDIINLSLGWYEDSLTDSDKAALEAAINKAYNHGIVIVAAAGNSGGDIAYPAKFENVIAVGNLKPVYTSGSSEPCDVTRNPSSSYGPELDFCAPGTFIISTYPGCEFANATGTSMAAPMITGICALVLNTNPYLSPAEVKKVLINATENLGKEGFDIYYGYGQVDAEEAVEEAKRAIPLDSDGDGLSDGYEMRVTGTNPYNPDSDYDGLSDSLEINTYGTNPLSPDTDNDDMSDDWELRHNLNPTDSSDAYLDPDGDGLTNHDEYYAGTDPHNSDTDGDGYSDGFELHPSYPYDPTPSDPTDPYSVPTISGFSKR